MSNLPPTNHVQRFLNPRPPAEPRNAQPRAPLGPSRLSRVTFAEPEAAVPAASSDTFVPGQRGSDDTLPQRDQEDRPGR